MNKAKVLVVDDNQSSRKIANYLLQEVGSSFIEVDDGECAVAEVINEVPDFIILDWQMPKLNGAEALQLLDLFFSQLHKHSEMKNKIPVLIYTSVHLYEVTIPETKYFRILGLISKKWSLAHQKKQFCYLISEYKRNNQ